MKVMERTPELSLRERNKADKLRRIKQAARKLFNLKGYEATTIKDIADVAGVSVGTIFLYARDKGDLVCLMAGDRLKDEFARAFERCGAQKPLLEQLVAVCAHMFKDSARDIPLSRILIKQMVSYRSKHRIDEWIEAHFQQLLARAVEREEIKCGEDLAFVAHTINLSYLAVMRHWIMNDRPRPAQGTAKVRRIFQLLLTGLKYRPFLSEKYLKRMAAREA
jgi:AcrR family transcriptional regulator